MVVVVGRGRGALTATSCDSSKTQDEEVSEETRRGGVKERKGFRGDKEASKEMSEESRRYEEETMRSNRSIPIDNITCNQ